MKSMRRALKCDGVLPVKLDAAGVKAYIDANRAADGPFDIVVEGTTAELAPEERRAKLAEWERAGATWWIEGMWGASFEEATARIRTGLL
jgi:hypothetical protein